MPAPKENLDVLSITTPMNKEKIRAALKNANILITGGTGSYGKHLTRTLLTHFHDDIRQIVIFSRDELKQSIIAEDLNEYVQSGKLELILGNVRDYDVVYDTLQRKQIDIIFHAAALKQVPAIEFNPFEAVKTNIHGPMNLIRAAKQCNVKKIIALSTDKAAAPVNFYGATKLCQDKMMVAANNMYAGIKRTPDAYAGYTGVKEAIVTKGGWKPAWKTFEDIMADVDAHADEMQISVVRYGNVLGSRGSILPIFLEQWKQIGRITITDKAMTRFTITLGEGVAFSLNCLANMKGGEIWVPKIPSYNIMDMAKFVAPGAEVKIIGIRPGEKLHELMIPNDEAMNTIEFSDHYIIGPNARWWTDRREFYMSSSLGGKRVPNDYEYSSGRNTQWITADYVHKEIENLQEMERRTGKNSKDDLSAPSPTRRQDTGAGTGASRM